MVVGRGKYGSYTLCLFTFYVLTFEDRKCFLTQNHLFPKLLATLAHNNILLLRTLAAYASSPIPSWLSEGFCVLVKHTCLVSPRGWCWKQTSNGNLKWTSNDSESEFCHLWHSHWRKLFNLSRPSLLLALLLSHNCED